MIYLQTFHPDESGPGEATVATGRWWIKVAADGWIKIYDRSTKDAEPGTGMPGTLVATLTPLDASFLDEIAKLRSQVDVLSLRERVPNGKELKL